MTLTPAPTSSIPATGTLQIVAWPDRLIDRLGFDPRSAYVESYWLSTLGPSTTWLLRRLAHGLELAPDGFELDLSGCARELGLGDKGGRHSPFARALTRLVQFEIARWEPTHRTLAVRRHLPPINRHQVMHLPEALRQRHDNWQARQLDTEPTETVRRRCRSLALVLLQTGEDREGTERQLLRWGFHPALCYESTASAAGEVAASPITAAGTAV